MTTLALPPEMRLVEGCALLGRFGPALTTALTWTQRPPDAGRRGPRPGGRSAAVLTADAPRD